MHGLESVVRGVDIFPLTCARGVGSTYAILLDVMLFNVDARSPERFEGAPGDCASVLDQ